MKCVKAIPAGPATGKHFACVDLANIDGDVYDVNFFLAYPVLEIEGKPAKAKVEFLFERKS